MGEGPSGHSIDHFLVLRERKSIRICAQFVNDRSLKAPDAANAFCLIEVNDFATTTSNEFADTIKRK
jgi:hypothetical protein